MEYGCLVMAVISDDLWMERMSRATWPQLATIVGAFLLAIGMGTSLAWFVRPGSDLFKGASCFAFLIVFMGGYSMWLASATTLMTSHLFKGVWTAFLRFVWRRRQGDLRSAAEGFYRNVSDRERLRDVVRRIRRRTVLFRVFGIALGCQAD